MSILIFAIVVIVVVAMFMWAEGMLPFDGRLVQLIQALTVIVGAVAIAQRAGVF